MRVVVVSGIWPPDVGGPAVRPLTRLGTGPEEPPALRRELRLVRDHTGGDAIDVGNEVAAQPHGVRRAGLLLLRGIGESGWRTCGYEK